MTVFVVIGLVLAALGVVVARLDVAGEPRRLTHPEGGVSLEAPEHWSIEGRMPNDPRSYELFVGHENEALGFVQRGGFWVSRWPARDDLTLASIKRTMAASGGDGRHDVEVGEGTLAGRPAAVLRYKTSPRGMRRLRFGDTSFVVRQVVVGDFQFQVGTWTAPRSGDTADRLERLVASVQFFPPQPWLARADGTQLKLPGGWTKQRTKIGRAVFFAVSPGDPNDAWVYVFHYKDTPAASLRAARRNLTQHGNRILRDQETTLRGEPATRLDIEFTDEGYANPAHGSEWFISDGRDGTYVLAVAYRAGDPSITDQLAADWRF